VPPDGAESRLEILHRPLYSCADLQTGAANRFAIRLNELAIQDARMDIGALSLEGDLSPAC
jgi:hypothetical protein